MPYLSIQYVYSIKCIHISLIYFLVIRQFNHWHYNEILRNIYRASSPDLT